MPDVSKFGVSSAGAEMLGICAGNVKKSLILSNTASGERFSIIEGVIVAVFGVFSAAYDFPAIITNKTRIIVKVRFFISLLYHKP